MISLLWSNGQLNTKCVDLSRMHRELFHREYTFRQKFEYIFRVLSYDDNQLIQLIVKFSLSRIIIKGAKMQTNDLNEESNSFSIGFAPLQKRTIKTEPQHDKRSEIIQERIAHLDHRLMVNITIVTSAQLKSYSFRNQLKNYRFQRKSKPSNIFNEMNTFEERQIQQFFATFKDIFSLWRDKLNHKIFIAFNNGDLVYFFHKPQQDDLKQGLKKGGSFAILSCKKSSYQKIFDDYNITYQKLQNTEFQNERLLLKNKSVQLFWKYLTNNSMQKSIQFEVVSNFYFLNSSEVLPLENYNGKEQRPQFQHIAVKRKNILGQYESQLYSMKIEGFWMKENALNLFKKLEQVCDGKPFQMDFQCHSGSYDIKKECDKL